MFALWSEEPPDLIFSPHLAPIPRGLLSTIYVPVRAGWGEKQLHDLFRETYADESFVKILPIGEVATMRQVNYSNRCTIGMTQVDGVLLVTSAIDNLLKGASGQAVQNMNVAFGLKETAGLL